MKHKFGNANYYLGNEIAKIRKADGFGCHISELFINLPF